jgi:hypothetical protein
MPNLSTNIISGFIKWVVTNAACGKIKTIFILTCYTLLKQLSSCFHVLQSVFPALWYVSYVRVIKSSYLLRRRCTVNMLFKHNSVFCTACRLKNTNLLINRQTIRNITVYAIFSAVWKWNANPLLSYFKIIQ